MNIKKQLVFVLMLIALCGLYILPWKNFGVNTDFLNKPYTLGLDLQGGVELDYKIDFSEVKTSSGSHYNEMTIVESLKRIIDKRVNSLGLAEPNIQTMKYGSETHLIVQIPTKDYKDLWPEEKKKQQEEDIKNAKATIGKVVQLEFKELKTEFTEADKKEREQIAQNLQKDLQTDGFDATKQKYTTQYENIFASSGTGTLPKEIQFPEFANIQEFPYISPVSEAVIDSLQTVDEAGNPVIKTSTGLAIVQLDARLGSGSYDYKYFIVDPKPTQWQVAKTKDGKILSDAYLNNASVYITPVGEAEVLLNFNEAGKQIFWEISSRLIGKQLAIYVWWEMLTAPVVQDAILNGQATINGQKNVVEAQNLVNDINTGIVPAPIYLTSERTIDAKIGDNALSKILIAGFIGLAWILLFLVFFYRIGGLIAGAALIVYTLFLVTIVKMTWVVLTLASVAGVILSIGMAIDANILIFERVREALKDKKPLDSAIKVWFNQSWTAIWDSHVTSLTSAFILFLVGVSLIKWFGLMLGIGIIVSLFTAMWVSRVFLLFIGKKMKKQTLLFIGYKK